MKSFAQGVAMDLHPAPQNRLVLQTKAAELDPIRRALHESEDWYQDLVDHSQDLLCVHDLEGRLLSVNPAPARLLGYSVEEMLRIPMREHIAPEFRNEFDAYLKEVEREGEARGLLVVVTRSGERRLWEYWNTLRRDGMAKTIVSGMARDVTEQRQTEKLLQEATEGLLHRVRESERVIRELKLFRTLVDQSNDALEVVDPDTLRFLDVNEKACSDLGYSREELLTLGVFDIDPGITESSVAKMMERLRESGSLVAETLHRRKDGSTFPVELSLSRVQLDREYVIAICRNLTERKEAEARLRESESRYRAVHDLSPVGICRVETRSGRLLEVNPKYCEILGRTQRDLLGLKFQSITHSGDLASNLEKVRQLEEGAVRHYEMEKRYLRPDGSVRWAEVDVVAMWPEADDPAWHLAIVQDITERKHSEERLGEYERVVESLEEMIVVVDRDYRYVIANRAYLHNRGLQKEQVIGRRIGELVNRESVEQIIKRLDECFQGKVVQYEMTYKYPQAGERDLLISYFPMEGPTGVDRIACILKDITERKQAAEALRKSEEKFSKAFRQSPMALTLSSIKTHHYIDVNETFERLTGWRRDEVIGRTAVDIGLWAPADGADLAKLLLTEGSVRNVEARYRMRDESVRIGLSTAEVIELNGEPCMLAVTADITERKQAEEALRTSEQQQQQIAKQLETERARLIEAQAVAKVGSWEIDLPNLEITWSEQTHRIFETDPSRFRPRRPDFVELIHPEDRAKVDATFEASLEKGAPSTVEYRIVMADGRVKLLEEHWKVFHNEQGCPVRLVGTCHDITERKLAQEALRSSEEEYRLFVSQSSEGIFREEMDAPVSINLSEDELVHHILFDSYLGECNDAMARMYGLQSGKELVGKRLTEMVVPDDPNNIELTREYIRSGFRVLERESHEVDVHGNPKIFLNSMIGTVENGMLVRTWGIQRDITEKVRLEEARRKAEESLRQNVAQLQQVTEELRLATEKLAEEKLYLEETIDTELGFGEIIGRSGAMKEVLEKVAKVAPSDATVLLLGETGTGKELVARALHRLSKRQGNSFIKLNCAAIPSGLLESELFGHEKGAFTGAVARKVGRLELADKGTLFLDEIGEIPLSLQPKLLRVLQDQEFERLGGTQTLKVNFRLLAATNRDLLQSLRVREFRSDLYYRLNVFPILIPPLRERREDIRPLIEHFVRKFAARMKKSIISIPSKTMEMLVRWEWPGNIRELENFVERSVILTPGPVLQAPLSELQTDENGDGAGKDNLRAQDRARILRALRECRGKLGGPEGAAARLGLKRTTLQSKLDNLGIKPGEYRA
jgi:PAS domain S-box-containing protein